MPFAYSGLATLSHKTTDYAPFVLGMPPLPCLPLPAKLSRWLKRPTPTEQPELAVPTTQHNPPASEQRAAAVTYTSRFATWVPEVPPQIKQQIAVWLEPFKQLLAKKSTAR